MVEEKQSLTANLESVQAEADFTKEQLEMAKGMRYVYVNLVSVTPEVCVCVGRRVIP